MTTKSQTAIRATESDGAFQELMLRFLMATERLKLAAHALSLEEKNTLPRHRRRGRSDRGTGTNPREFGRFEMNHKFIAKEVQS